MLNTDFPVVEGRYQLTGDWSVSLPGKFNRRIEDGDLVLWNPELTLWIAVWKNDSGTSKESRLASIRQAMSAQACDQETSGDATLLRFSYRLKEQQDAVPAFYCFAIGERGQVEMAIYPEQEAGVKAAQAILQSLHETNAA